jgi:molybdopterin converting factor small subunit
MESPLRAVRILYSGILAERRGLAEEEIHLGSVTTVAALCGLLNDHHPLGLVPELLRVEINGAAGDINSLVGPGDEVALEQAQE